MTGRQKHDAAVMQNVDNPRLVEALEANTAAAYADMARNPESDVYSGPDMTRFISGAPNPILNGVAGASLPEDRLDAVLNKTMERFIARAVPMTWWVSPSTHPDGLGARLEAHGLRYDGETPGMAVNINSLSQAGEAAPSLTIAPATSEDDLREWARIMARGFGILDETQFALKEMALRHCLRDDPQWIYYLARLDGQPVATTSMFPYAGVAGIYCVATLPEARKRGIGAEITRVALQQAGEQGYRVGILQASGMGFPVYRRMGFATVLTFQLYSWTPGQG